MAKRKAGRPRKDAALDSGELDRVRVELRIPAELFSGLKAAAEAVDVSVNRLVEALTGQCMKHWHLGEGVEVGSSGWEVRAKRGCAFVGEPDCELTPELREQWGVPDSVEGPVRGFCWFNLDFAKDPGHEPPRVRIGSSTAAGASGATERRERRPRADRR